jgi:hypothetical protein
MPFKTLILGVALMTSLSNAAETKSPAEFERESPTESETRSPTAFLEISLKIQPKNRPAAVEVYKRYKQPFLKTIPGAVTKQLLIRDEDVQVLHGFDSVEHAADYLESPLFTQDVVTALEPLLEASPEVRIYSVY